MPRQAWTKKQERQYQHIKESATDRGTSKERAEEIAARTVNKQRRQRGETQNTRSQGTGNPTQSLEGRTKQELYNRAKALNIEGRSKMSKSELIRAIRSRG
jgi:plasmid stabilization system protein ParE